MSHKNKSDAGYGPNNPEPQEFKESTNAETEKSDALHASLEYINSENSSEDNAKPHMPCKNSLPT